MRSHNEGFWSGEIPALYPFHGNILKFNTSLRFEPFFVTNSVVQGQVDQVDLGQNDM